VALTKITGEGTGSLDSLTVAGDLTVDTNTLKVDSSGNVGIGTSSPNNNSGRTTLTIDNASQGGAIDLEHNGTVVGKFICDGANTLGIQADGNRDVLFKTNGSGRMLLKSNGRVSVGFTGDIGPAIMQLDGGSGCALGIRAGSGTSGFFNQVLFANNANTALIGSIQRVNDASVQYNTTSDARLKENIADMTGAIARVKQLSPKRYSWVNEDLDAADQDGFLAHETQTVVPGAVSGTQDEVDGDGNPVYMQMDYSKLVPLLTAALKESIAKIETLEARVKTLEDA